MIQTIGGGCRQHPEQDITEALFGLCGAQPHCGSGFEKILSFQVNPPDDRRPRDVPRPEVVRGETAQVPADQIYLMLGGDACVDSVLSGSNFMACTYGCRSRRRTAFKEVVTQATQQIVQRAQHMRNTKLFSLRTAFLECKLFDPDSNVVHDHFDQQILDAAGVSEDTADSIMKQLTAKNLHEYLQRVSAWHTSPSKAHSSGHFIFHLEARHANDIGSMTIVSLASLEKWREKSPVQLNSSQALPAHVASLNRLGSIIKALAPKASHATRDSALCLLGRHPGKYDRCGIDSFCPMSAIYHQCLHFKDSLKAVQSTVEESRSEICYGFSEKQCVLPSPAESEQCSFSWHSTSTSTSRMSSTDVPSTGPAGDMSYTQGKVDTRKLFQGFQDNGTPLEMQVEKMRKLLEQQNSVIGSLMTALEKRKSWSPDRCSGEPELQIDAVESLGSVKTSWPYNANSHGGRQSSPLARPTPGQSTTGHPGMSPGPTNQSPRLVRDDLAAPPGTSEFYASHCHSNTQALLRSGSAKDFSHNNIGGQRNSYSSLVLQGLQGKAVSPHVPPRDMPPARSRSVVQNSGSPATHGSQSILAPQGGSSVTMPISHAVHAPPASFDQSPRKERKNSSPPRSPPPGKGPPNSMDLTPHSAREVVVHQAPWESRGMGRGNGVAAAMRWEQSSPGPCRIPQIGTLPKQQFNVVNRSPQRTYPPGRAAETQLNAPNLQTVTFHPGAATYPLGGGKSPTRLRVRH